MTAFVSRFSARLILGLGMALWMQAPTCPSAESPSLAGGSTDQPVRYFNDVVRERPWSVHVVKIDRRLPGLAFTTTLGHGGRFGMATLTEQLKTLAPSLGSPLAAVNGDYYETGRYYDGRPRDLQISQGEVITDPAGNACFWLDADAQPHLTNVLSRFRVVWSAGRETPFGLNEKRGDDEVVLYTPAVGPSTRSTGGQEWVLEDPAAADGFRLRIGRSHKVLVRSVRAGGDTPVPPGKAVLSIGPALVASLPPPREGETILELVTETIPDLAGAETAIGGGPTLVRDGKPMEWNTLVQLRHPRSAVGWNDTHFFLVEVDGRQRSLSIGMTFPEWARYLVKLGCREAMNFDGGGSASLWAFGNLQSSPSEGEERPGPNALVVLRRHKTR